MTLRAAKALADNANPILERLVAGLTDDGVDITIDGLGDPADADLLFACGLLTMELIRAGRGRTIVAAPRFPGEAAPTYRSVIVAREPMTLASATDRTLAVNDFGSWSGRRGYEAFLREAGLTVNRAHVVTGGHIASAEAVRSGAADVAAIDATVWRDLVDHDGLVEIATTGDWPTPPLSLSTRIGPDAIADITAILHRQPGVEPVDESTYRFMLGGVDPGEVGG